MRRVPEHQEYKNPIEAQVLAFAEACLQNPAVGMSRQEIAAILFGPSMAESDGEDRSRTFTRRLSLAVEWGWLEREGQARATLYRPTPEFLHVMAMRHIAKPMVLRPKVSYDIDLLRDYEPNRTFYLSQAQRQMLHARCRPGSFNCKDPAQGQLMRRFMTDLSHHSALLEGVRANYIDTIALLEDNIQSKNMSEHDAVTLRNLHRAASILVMASGFPADPRDMRVSESDICQIHAVVSDGLLMDRRDQGRLRSAPVEIQYCQYLPLAIPDQVQAAFRLLVDKAQAIDDPYEQAFFLCAHLPYLQPFSDCNKRTARVVCNIPLLSKGVLPISWREVTLRDYHDALLCLYEKKSFYGMTQIFTEAYARSVERFDIEQKQRQPSHLEVIYARQIEQVVRRRVLEGDVRFRPAMPPEHWSYIEGYIASVLKSALDNDMVLAPYRIAHQDWKAWRDAVLAQGETGLDFGDGADESLAMDAPGE